MTKTKFLRWAPLKPIPLDKEKKLAPYGYDVHLIYSDLIETVNKIMDLCIYWESYPPWYERKKCGRKPKSEKQTN